MPYYYGLRIVSSGSSSYRFFPTSLSTPRNLRSKRLERISSRSRTYWGIPATTSGCWARMPHTSPQRLFSDMTIHLNSNRERTTGRYNLSPGHTIIQATFVQYTSSYIIYIFGSYQGDKTFRAAWKLLAPVTRMFILGPRAFLASTTTYENWITCLLFQKTKFRCQTNSYKQIENMQASLRLDKYGWEWDKIKRSRTEIPLKE
jgi:hypothetical protein